MKIGWNPHAELKLDCVAKLLSQHFRIWVSISTSFTFVAHDTFKTPSRIHDRNYTITTETICHLITLPKDGVRCSLLQNKRDTQHKIPLCLPNSQFFHWTGCEIPRKQMLLYFRRTRLTIVVSLQVYTNWSLIRLIKFPIQTFIIWIASWILRNKFFATHTIRANYRNQKP